MERMTHSPRDQHVHSACAKHRIAQLTSTYDAPSFVNPFPRFRQISSMESMPTVLQ